MVHEENSDNSDRVGGLGSTDSSAKASDDAGATVGELLAAKAEDHVDAASTDNPVCLPAAKPDEEHGASAGDPIQLADPTAHSVARQALLEEWRAAADLDLERKFIADSDLTDLVAVFRRTMDRLAQLANGSQTDPQRFLRMKILMQPDCSVKASELGIYFTHVLNRGPKMPDVSVRLCVVVCTMHTPFEG